MAGKNWLIRTRNKQILGPATKEKVIELIEKGSLTADDELTSGNGYWFWIREQDLIDKYLYGDVPQGFNPISEAEDVLTAKTSPDGITASVTETPQAKAPEPSPSDNVLPEDDDLAYPDDDDLAYPDMGNEEEHIPEDSDLEYPDIGAEESEEIIAEASEVVLEEEPLSLEPEVSLEAAPAVELEEIPEEGEENFLYPDAADLEYPILEGQEEEIIGDETAEHETPELDEDVTDPNVEIPMEMAHEEVLEEEPVAELLMKEQPAPTPAPKKAAREKVVEQEPQDSDEDLEEDFEEAPKRSKKKKKIRKKKKRKVVTERKGNDRYLFLILFLLFTAIGVVFYYYKEVLNKPFPVLGMHSAHAQTLQSLSKKKVS